MGRTQNRRTGTFAAVALSIVLTIPTRAAAQETFFTQPTTDTQPVGHPGLTFVDTAGLPSLYVASGLLGVADRAEISLAYAKTSLQQAVLAGRVRLLDETKARPAVAFGFLGVVLSSMTASAPSPDDLYAVATKHVGDARFMLGAYRIAPEFARDVRAPDDAGFLAAAELNLDRTFNLRTHRLGPPAVNLDIDFAGGDNPFGGIGAGIGVHPNDHMDIQPGIVFPTNKRYGPLQFQLQLHLY
jgi:hypothetical protein